MDQHFYAVNLFNQNETNLKLDAALHELFSPPPGGSRLALSAFALDALWNAGISRHYHDWPGWQKKSGAIRFRFRTRNSIRKYLRSSLLLKNLLDLTQHTTYYVFGTKFMYWWVGTPPIDRDAAGDSSALRFGDKQRWGQSPPSTG